MRDYTGQRFGRRVVLQHAATDRWQWKCDCGTTGECSIKTMRGRHSCGCLQKETTIARQTKHGRCGTPEYRAWQHIICRCYDHNNNYFHRYGGRGIKVCDRWRYSFESFLSDMGTKPSSSHQIDRINNDGDYGPLNCRWSTPSENSRNTCQNRHYTVNGETKLLCEWCDELGCDPRTVYYRLNKGWGIERALTTPVRGRQHVFA